MCYVSNICVCLFSFLLFYTLLLLFRLFLSFHAQDVIEAAGGIHTFARNPKPMITDSGGFQIFSLANIESQNELKGRVATQEQSTVLKVRTIVTIANAVIYTRMTHHSRLTSLAPDSSRIGMAK